MARKLGLQGIDISQHQGSAVLDNTAGLSFVVLRASIATTKDTDYDAFYAKARAAGLVVMAYHFGYPASSGASIAAQVAFFLNVAKGADFLWIDQEQSGFDDVQTQRFVDLVRKAGRPIGLYHSASGFGGVNADARWVADYRAESVSAGYPRNVATGAELAWDLWQWSSTGTRPGYTGNVDLDWLNPNSPLASILRKGYITKAASDADLAAAKALLEGKVADLSAKLDAALKAGAASDAKVLELSAQIRADQEAIASLSAALDAAPGLERERIAQAMGNAEADRVRNAQ